jgi:hypothetical protein
MPTIPHRAGQVRGVLVSLALVSALLGQPASVHGQPYVPPRGEGTVSLTYQNYYVTGHFDLQGRENTNGATHSQAFGAEFDIGLTDTIGFSVGVPFIASKYTGPPVYFVAGNLTTPGPLDDGTYHGAVQDFRVEMRRLFAAGPVAVAPFAGVSIPSHGYETIGEAVPGRGRVEFQFGAAAGVPLDRLIPGAYVQARYGIGAAPPLDGFKAVRSNIDLETGWAITSHVAIRGLLGWQFRLAGPLASEFPADDWVSHDRFIVGDYFNAGGGTTIALTRSLELYGVWVATLSGKNGAHVARLLSVGATWTFGGNFGGFSASIAHPNQSARASSRATSRPMLRP